MQPRPVLECAVLAVLIALGFVVEKHQGGATLVYVGLIPLYAGSVFRRLLVLARRARPAPWWTLALEVGCLTGLVVRPIGLWSHAMLAVVALSVATAPPGGVEPDDRATLVEEIGVALVALVGAAAALILNRAGATASLVLATPLALEAWGPRSPRTVASAARRAAAFGVVASAGIMQGQDWRPGVRVDELVLTVLIVLAFVATFEVLGRTVARNPAARLDDALGRVATVGERGFGAVIGVCAALAILGAALIGTGTLRVPTTRLVERTTIEAEKGLAFFAPGVDAHPDNQAQESTLAVLEDGVPLGPAHVYYDEIRERGHGRYRHDPRRITFSSSDGTDPRTNGRSYVFRYDWAPGDALLAALVIVAAVLNARRAARLAALIERAPPPLLGAIVLAVALAFRVQVLLTDTGVTMGHLVKGVPFSDARDWYSVAVDFSRNERSAGMWYWCDARRPFHYALLGAIFAITGPSIALVRAFNIALSALTAVLVFDATRRVSTRLVALFAALTPALLLYDARQDLSVMTEPLGDFLAVLAVWAFVCGSERAVAPGRWRPAALAFLGGGVALGLSNLARPLTLLAAAGLPLALALVATRVAVSRRRVLGAGIFFGGGAGLAVWPWMLRQRLVYGFWTISENTAEAWYGATSPVYKSWSSDVSALAGDRNVTDRVHFFMEGASRNLHEHLGWYAGHVIDQLGVVVRFSGPPAWVVVGACASYVVRALAAPERAGERRGLAVAAALVAIIAALAPEPPLYAIALLGLILALVSRRPLAVPGGFHVVTAASIAMIAMAFERRLTHSIEWTAAAFAAAAVLEALAWVESAAAPPPPRLGDAGSWGKTGRAIGVAAAVFVLIVLGGFARVVTIPRPPRRVSALPTDPWVPAALDASTRERLGPLAERVVARRARIRPGFEIPIAAGERLMHWSPMFEPRPYAFTIFEMEPELPENYAVWPGTLPRAVAGGELVLIGVPVARDLCGGTLELLAVAPAAGDAPPREWLRPDASVVRAHIAALSSASSPR